MRNQKLLRDVVVWSKLDILVDKKIFMIKSYNPVEGTQIIDRGLMATTQSG